MPTPIIERLFTNGTHPFELISWERRDAYIPGPSSDKPTFSQPGVSVPAFWSQSATNIVAQKYFRGQLNTPEREWSAKQLIGRVVERIGLEGRGHGYFQSDEEQEAFEHELAYLLVNQMMAFNSPVWFNIGVKNSVQQAAACYILSVEDDMQSILNWYVEEGLIFQGGSGAGINLSNLRGSGEQLAGGGTSSGPVTFMRGADASAGTIKSGGKCLAPWQKVYTAEYGPIAVSDLDGQEFTVLSYDPPEGRVKAKKAQAWKQDFQKEMLEIVTDKGSFTLSSDHPIRLADHSTCEAGDLRIGTALFAGHIDFDEGYPNVHLKNGEVKALQEMISEDIPPAGGSPPTLDIEEIQSQLTNFGFSQEGNLFQTPGQDLQAGYQLINIEGQVPQDLPADVLRELQSNTQTKISMCLDPRAVEELAQGNHRVTQVKEIGLQDCYDVEVDCPTLDDKSPESGHNFLIWSGGIQSGSGIFVFNTRRAAKLVCLDVDHPDIRDFIWCKAWEEDKARALANAGFDMQINTEAGHRNWASLQYQNANNSVRASDEFMQAVEDGGDWNLTARTSGEVNETVSAKELMGEIAHAAWQCADPGLQFDTTINDWHTTPEAGRIRSSNPCGEYLHVDDSSCNLASLNLMKFRDEDGQFQVEIFKHAVQVTFLAQEILIAFADYPTPAIGKNTQALRQIGLGHTNLGAYLMAEGLAYDSDEARMRAAAITSLMTGEAYLQSTRIAERLGSFEYFEDNREATIRVLKKHRTYARKLHTDKGFAPVAKAAKQAWDQTVQRAEEHGVRNAQASVSAPTGCVTPETMVLTGQGLVRIDEIGDLNGAQWQDLDVQVSTDAGNANASRFYINGLATVARLKTASGHTLKATPQHRVKTVDSKGEWGWKRISDLQKGSFLPLRLGGMIGEPRAISLPPISRKAPTLVSPDLASLAGYFALKGSLDSKGLHFSVDAGALEPTPLQSPVAFEDNELVYKIKKCSEKLFGGPVNTLKLEGGYRVSLNSATLARWWAAGDLGRGQACQKCGTYCPRIPFNIRASNDPEIYGAFLQGLFEAGGDGNAITISTKCELFAGEIQTLLLALGIGSSMKTKSNGNVSLTVKSPDFVRIFEEKVGFWSEKKPVSLETPGGWQNDDKIPMTKSMVDHYCPERSPLREQLLQGVKKEGMVSRKLALQIQSSGPQECQLEFLLKFMFDPIEMVELSEEAMTYDLSVPGRMTYIANGMISHNTISFLLDCDTTGIEPEFSLVKTKSLVGGGSMTIANRTVPVALSKLGYQPQEIEAITAYIREHNTVVDAPYICEPHYPIFAVAVGENAISPQGHIDMLAALQPHFSGGLSKTVNVPADTTVQHILDLYMDAWRKGVKCVSVYRDGSKAVQPLNTKRREKEAQEVLTSILGDDLLRGQRRRVPVERQVVSRHFRIGAVSGYIHVGLFEDGKPGDLFVTVAQAGSALRGMIDAWSTTFSLALQYGAPLEALVSKLAFTSFEPSGLTNDPNLRMAKSIVDYVARWMAGCFLHEIAKQELGFGSTIETASALPASTGEDFTPVVRIQEDSQKIEAVKAPASGDICSQCGSPTLQRTGSCYTCSTCGFNTGCG